MIGSSRTSTTWFLQSTPYVTHREARQIFSPPKANRRRSSVPSSVSVGISRAAEDTWLCKAAASDSHDLEAPWRKLGVPADADETTIKKAYRRLVLKFHPDHNRGDSGAFIQVQRAYENLIKHRGEDVPVGHDSWNFHDWHWKFRMRRAWAAKHGRESGDADGPHSSTARVVPEHRTQVQLQLAALKRRAAVRSAKLAASQAFAAASRQPQWSAADDHAIGGVPMHRQQDGFTYAHDPLEDARMGAREAAASVAFAYEQRQRRQDESHVHHEGGGSSSTAGRHAGSAAAPLGKGGLGAELGGVAEYWRPQQEHPGQHAGDGETPSRRSVPSGHLSAQLAGLRRKSMLKTELEVSEV